MKKVQLFKLLFGIVINYLILGAITFAFSSHFNFLLENSAYVIGLLTLIFGICFNIIGSPMGASIQYSGNKNSQYESKVDLTAKDHENNKDKIIFNIRSIIVGAIIISSLLILITSFFL